MSEPASRRDWLCLAAVFALPFAWRLALIGWLTSHGTTLPQLLGSGDVPAFFQMARAMLDWTHIPEFALGGNSRVFPLWPSILAALMQFGVSGWAWLLVAPLFAGAASAIFYRITGSFAGALLLGVAPPAWVLATLSPMSEGIFLCLGLLAALALRRDHCFLAGFLVGAMVATRPFGVAWALAGVVVILAASGDRVGRFGAFAAGAVIGGFPLLVVNVLMFGDVLHQVRVYSSDLRAINLPPDIAARLGDASGHWGFPFKHLLTTPWLVPVPAWKILYVYANLALLLGLLPIIWRQFRASAETLAAENFLALAFVANGLLSVSTGPYWGFHSFDRYLSWAAPGAIVAVRRATPPRLWPWLAGATGIVSLASVVFATSR
jgi:hypothetical protein